MMTSNKNKSLDNNVSINKGGLSKDRVLSVARDFSNANNNAGILNNYYNNSRLGITIMLNRVIIFSTNYYNEVAG